MAITERGSGFQVSLTHKGQRFRKMVPTREEAEKLEAQVRLDFLGGKDPTRGIGMENRVTMRDLFLKTKAEAWRALTSKPRRNAELLLEDFDLWETSPAQLDAERWSSIWDTLRDRGNSESTINRKKAAVSKMYSVAIELEWLDRKPGGLKQTKESTGRVRYLTKDEETAILGFSEQMGYHRLYNLAIFLIDTGARISEALELEPSDLTPKGVYLNTKKGGDARLVPLTERARTAASKFAGLTQDAAGYQWDRVREQLGRLNDKSFTPHICRHTCASRLVSGGLDLRKVQAWLGHKSIATTLRYAHLMPDALSGGVDILETNTH